MKRKYWLTVALCCTFLLLICTLFGCNKPAKEQLYTLSFPENFVKDSLFTTENGLSFLLSAPDGKQIRFYADNAEFAENGALTVHMGGALYHEDAIGKISEVTLTTVEASPKLHYSLGYTFGEEKVQNLQEIYQIPAFGKLDKLDTSGLLPNFISVKAQEGMVESIVSHPLQEFTVTAFSITYTPGITELKGLSLDPAITPTFLAGDPYDAGIEAPTPLSSSKTPDFALIAVPDAPAATAARKDSSVHGITEGFQVSALKDGKGTVCDKSKPLPENAVLEVTFVGKSYDVPLTQKEFTGAQNLSQLVPSVYAPATGKLRTLVVPIVWNDHKDLANEHTLEILRQSLGRVQNADGSVADYTASSDYSLSSYFDMASYGKLQVESYISDWYYHSYTFSAAKNMILAAEEANAIVQDIMARNPQTDWKQFDADHDGWLDAVVFINTGAPNGLYEIFSNSGAFHSAGYLPQKQEEGPAVNAFTSISLGFLHRNITQSTQGALSARVLIHEFSHGLGVEDYYDKTASGIDAVGRYDMQSQNVGDWNVYSKFAAGWVEPTVISDALFANGNSVELTLRSFAKYGDCILIPAAGESFDGSPFGEYLLVDFYTNDGVHRYDSAKYGLNDAEGVRIYHVNAKQMEKYLQSSDGSLDAIGVPARSNSYGYMAQRFGIYAVELIQAGGVNTFTSGERNSRMTLTADDLFQGGDCFTTEDYSAFFHQGKMDDGKALGYRIEIVSIEDGSATLRMIKQ